MYIDTRVFAGFGRETLLKSLKIGESATKIASQNRPNKIAKKPLTFDEVVDFRARFAGHLHHQSVRDL